MVLLRAPSPNASQVAAQVLIKWNTSCRWFCGLKSLQWYLHYTRGAVARYRIATFSLLSVPQIDQVERRWIWFVVDPTPSREWWWTTTTTTTTNHEQLPKRPVDRGEQTNKQRFTRESSTPSPCRASKNIPKPSRHRERENSTLDKTGTEHVWDAARIESALSEFNRDL